MLGKDRTFGSHFLPSYFPPGQLRTAPLDCPRFRRPSSGLCRAEFSRPLRKIHTLRFRCRRPAHLEMPLSTMGSPTCFELVTGSRSALSIHFGASHDSLTSFRYDSHQLRVGKRVHPFRRVNGKSTLASRVTMCWSLPLASIMCLEVRGGSFFPLNPASMTISLVTCQSCLQDCTLM